MIVRTNEKMFKSTELRTSLKISTFFKKFCTGFAEAIGHSFGVDTHNYYHDTNNLPN
jgi:hypothetical protein